MQLSEPHRPHPGIRLHHSPPHDPIATPSRKAPLPYEVLADSFRAIALHCIAAAGTAATSPTGLLCRPRAQAAGTWHSHEGRGIHRPDKPYATDPPSTATAGRRCWCCSSRRSCGARVGVPAAGPC